MKYYFLALGTLVFVCVGCAGMGDGQQMFDNGEYYAPPTSQLQRPGPMVDGPGPAVMAAMAAPPTRTFVTSTTQMRFAGPTGMHIGWSVPNGYAEDQLVAPGRYDFRQGATYRLKLTDIPGRDGLVLYPTLEVRVAHVTSDSYLSHNSVPIELTDEDLDFVESNNFVTKVLYLPDLKYQELAIAGVETLVSTRLDPGVDPVKQAERQGTIMAILRLGNMDLETPSRGAADKSAALPGDVRQIRYENIGYHAPTPMMTARPGQVSVPGAMMMGMPAGPGMPAYNVVSGLPGAPSWGMPMTATPIGLPGPPHLPLGGPASLKSHTVRNLTKVDIGKPVKHMLIDVEHRPGIRLPKPVKYIQYTESHPSLPPGAAAYPAWHSK